MRSHKERAEVKDRVEVIAERVAVAWRDKARVDGEYRVAAERTVGNLAEYAEDLNAALEKHNLNAKVQPSGWETKDPAEDIFTLSVIVDDKPTEVVRVVVPRKRSENVRVNNTSVKRNPKPPIDKAIDDKVTGVLLMAK
jgi:hypothetical protein